MIDDPSDLEKSIDIVNLSEEESEDASETRGILYFYRSQLRNAQTVREARSMNGEYIPSALNMHIRKTVKRIKEKKDKLISMGASFTLTGPEKHDEILLIDDDTKKDIFRIREELRELKKGDYGKVEE